MDPFDSVQELAHTCNKLFLALTLLKSKPDSLQLGDYVGRFRESVFLDVYERELTAQASNAEIMYWRRMYTESAELVATLKKKLEASEQRQANETDHLAIADTTPNPAKLGRERKRIDTTDTPAVNQAFDLSEQRQSLGYLLLDERAEQDALNELGLKTASPEGAILMQCVNDSLTSQVRTYLKHLYTLLKHLYPSKQHPTHLGQYVIWLSLGACEIIQKSVLDTLDTESLSGVQLIKRSFAHVTRACSHITSDGETHAEWDGVVFHITQVFQRLLDAISTATRSDRRPAEFIEIQSSVSHSTAALPDETSSQSTEAESLRRLCSELSSTAVLIIFELCCIGPTAEDMIRGCLHILCTKVGHILGSSLFEEPAEPRSGKKPSPETNAIEAQSMVWILGRITTILRKSHVREHNDERGPLSLDSTATDAGCQITGFSHILKSLQDTLLHTIFADQTLFPCRLLPTPTLDRGPTFVPNSELEQCSTWLESEVWRLLCVDTLHYEDKALQAHQL